MECCASALRYRNSRGLPKNAANRPALLSSPLDIAIRHHGSGLHQKRLMLTLAASVEFGHALFAIQLDHLNHFHQKPAVDKNRSLNLIIDPATLLFLIAPLEVRYPYFADRLIFDTSDLVDQQRPSTYPITHLGFP